MTMPMIWNMRRAGVLEPKGQDAVIGVNA